MTLPDERTHAVLYTKEFLLGLASGTIKRIPKAVRVRARMLLRHFPTSLDMRHAAKNAPNVFAEIEQRDGTEGT